MLEQNILKFFAGGSSRAQDEDKCIFLITNYHNNLLPPKKHSEWLSIVSFLISKVNSDDSFTFVMFAFNSAIRFITAKLIIIIMNEIKH